MMLGSETLAKAMGPDEDLAKIVDGPKRVMIHESCAMQLSHLMQLME